jgi:hypothetical protein
VYGLLPGAGEWARKGEEAESASVWACGLGEVGKRLRASEGERGVAEVVERRSERACMWIRLVRG